VTKPASLGRRRAAAAADSSDFYKERRQAVIDAAARVFQERGYEATTFVHIAEELQTDRASLYYYASSKKQLFEEVVRQASQANVEAVEAVARGAESPSEKLRIAFSWLMESYSSNYPYFRLFIQLYLNESATGAAGLDKENRIWAERYYKAIRSIIEQGVANGEFTSDLPLGILTIGVIGTANWIQVTGIGSARHHSKSKKPLLPPRDIGRGLADLLLNGLKQRSDHKT